MGYGSAKYLNQHTAVSEMKIKLVIYSEHLQIKVLFDKHGTPMVGLLFIYHIYIYIYIYIWILPSFDSMTIG